MVRDTPADWPVELIRKVPAAVPAEEPSIIVAIGLLTSHWVVPDGAVPAISGLMV
jgi:hypothetical protein